MRTRSAFLLSLVLVLPVLAPRVPLAAQASQTADEVVEKYLAAIGGREALGKLTSRRTTGTITVSTPNGDIAGQYEAAAKAPNKNRVYMKLDLSALGAPEPMIIEQKFDGVAGYAMNSMQGDTEITGNQLENMRNNLFPTPLLHYKTAGTKIELLPREQVSGKEMIVLQVTPKAGSVSKIYLDPETYLVARTVAKVNTPQAGDIEQVGEASDYRTVDGIKIPFKVVNSSPLQAFTIVLTKVEHNVPIDDALFSVKRQ